MPQQQIIYASTPFGFDAATLASILVTARHRNARNDVTGALICRSDIYLQLLEGPTQNVEDIYNRICQDDRHMDIKLLVRAKTADRLFPSWAMWHDPESTWIGSREDVHQGMLEKASVREIREIFLRAFNG
jgi:hypothetical protein